MIGSASPDPPSRHDRQPMSASAAKRAQRFAHGQVRRSRQRDDDIEAAVKLGDCDVGPLSGPEDGAEPLAHRRDHRGDGGIEHRTFGEIDDGVAMQLLKAENTRTAAGHAHRGEPGAPAATRRRADERGDFAAFGSRPGDRRAQPLQLEGGVGGVIEVLQAATAAALEMAAAGRRDRQPG
ncbi:MAG: hypothetical protein R3D02_15665 [Hyphomicrobiales bacterium]